MPPTTRGVKRDRLTYVFVNYSIMYGFKTQDISRLPGIAESELSVNLGHLAADLLNIFGESIRIFGANSPKPPRVKKKLQGTIKSVSTFCGYDYLEEAAEALWFPTSYGLTPRLTGPNSPRSKITAFVQIQRTYNETQIAEGFYGFQMNKQDFITYSQDLKLFSSQELTESEREKIFFGASAPKPGKASKTIIANGRKAVFTTFYDDSRQSELTNAGWKCSSETI